MKLPTAASPELRRADLLLAALVVGTVAMMIVPLPTFLIDLGIAFNLLLATLLVGTALYLRDALSFGAFPTILLLTTLYRLALNVSSTRLILLQADAGRVIEAFGSFVVRGDYVVGALVFVVLTLVQFIVIARGAERVAEVSARFSLDALPGKQMAIDSDLRAGNLSSEAARAQRKRLERESQLYGAMDGAMKFVKGDAVAGIIITLVNVIGGVALGVMARDLSLVDSLKRYGLLAIGDGLVTQIPALLAATSAGLVVTRVTAAEDDHSLSSDIASQLFGDTRVLAVGTVLLLTFAMLPHMPSLPFLAAASLGAALIVRQRARRPPRSTGEAQASLFVDAPLPLSIELGAELAQQLMTRGTASAACLAALAHTRQSLYRELGIVVPAPVFYHEPQLPPDHYRLLWRELPEPARARRGHEPIETELAEALGHLARRHADDLLGFEELQRMLEALERTSPTLIRLVVPRLIPLPLLAQVLRILVREGISVRWLSEVLEALAPLAEHERDPIVLAERARRALARRISSTLAPDGQLRALRLAPEIEEAISDAIKTDGSKQWLALPPALASEIIADVQRASRADPHTRALLTQSVLRRHVRTLLQDTLPELYVVCPEELSRSVVVVPAATIGP